MYNDMIEKINMKEINDKYIELWKEYEDEVQEVPLLYPELKTKTLLFIGINPSCPTDKLEERLEKIDSNLTAKELKKLEYSSIEEKRELLINQRKVATGNYVEGIDPYQYFKPFKVISEEVGLDWEHIDVFRTIAKKQSQLKDVLNISSNGKNISDLGKEQIKIFGKLLEKLQPKIIVVQNALARDIIKEYENEIGEINWDESEGFHTIMLNRKKIPIFFSGMLSGQRCLDNGSKKRLIWHIKRTKKWMKS